MATIQNLRQGVACDRVEAVGGGDLAAYEDHIGQEAVQSLRVGEHRRVQKHQVGNKAWGDLAQPLLRGRRKGSA